MQPANKTFKKGSFLFRENDLSKDMYIIHSGQVRVFRKEGSREVEICRLGKGAVLGEMALIDGRPRSASIQAEEDTQAFMLTVEDFSQKTKGIPPWFLGIIRIIIQRLRESNKRLHSTLNQNNCGNIATILQLIYRRHCEEADEKKLLDLKFAKKEIINILSIALAEVNKNLDELAKTKMIFIEKNKVEIPDVARFVRYAQYMRIRSTIPEDKRAILSDAARAFLVFLYNNMEKHGKRTEGGMEYSTNAFLEEAEKMLGSVGKNILEELSERGFFEVNPDPSAKDGEGSAPYFGNKILIVNEHRLEEFALVEEFEGPSLDVEAMEKLVK